MADRESVNYSSPSLKRSLQEIEGFCDSGTSPSGKQGLSPEFNIAKRSRSSPEDALLGVQLDDNLNGGLPLLDNPAQTLIDSSLNDPGPAGDLGLPIDAIEGNFIPLDCTH